MCKKELSQYLAVLTTHIWSITHISCTMNITCCPIFYGSIKNCETVKQIKHSFISI